MLTNCFRFAPRDSVPGLISKICKYLKEHPGWSVDELKEVIGDIETSLALGEVSYFTNQSINDLDTLALYDVGYRFVFIGGGDVYSAMYALEESDGGVIANGVALGVTESEFNQLKSIVLALNNAAYTATNPPPYPVTKVNNRAGDVKLDLADVLGESTAQTMLMSEINFASTQLATWNAFYDYGYRVVGVLANDGSAITALYILGQNVGNHAPIPMIISSGGNVISVNGDIGEVHTLRVDPNDPGIPTDPPTPINATTLNGKSAEFYAAKALISDAYSDGETYNSGDYCISANTLYKCLQDNVTGISTTNTTYWKAVTVSGELQESQRVPAYSYEYQLEAAAESGYAGPTHTVDEDGTFLVMAAVRKQVVEETTPYALYADIGSSGVRLFAVPGLLTDETMIAARNFASTTAVIKMKKGQGFYFSGWNYSTGSLTPWVKMAAFRLGAY